ncbi:di-trans,poly-cis-decaprenylcistransferase [Streptomyces roseirectus]|uniref:Isoprenyl transferase n=1 Tax=Streptomyces roseirectus TaxID=2768066 RepID=A0A7H0IRF4_9ACTN|nr:polyprenyl diphosphate synthase [Streptomyces roseirectus]QNP75370.1 di-trans,poly-cis-decaprenylcistransferase [Streptomyces roseirectus]
MTGNTPELRESYEACETEVRERLPALWTATGLLPAEVRPFMYAIHGWAVRTDRIADEGPSEGRAQRLARWRDDTLTELRTGEGRHPLRRALVDTVHRRDLDPALIEAHLAAVTEDSAAPPAFDTVADQRRFLRGITGIVGELWAPLLEPRGPESARQVAALFDACKMADLFEDLPDDLKAGRCYWPQDDLRDLGLTPGDLLGDGPRAPLDAFVDRQLAHWRTLLAEATPATWAVGEPYRLFLHSLLLGTQLHYDEVTLLRSRVLTEGVPHPTTDGRLTRREPWPGPRPGHVAVIMDGNRRWADAHGVPARHGHHAGARATMRLINSALRLGIRHLSVYAFSTENWNRAQEETTAIFDTLADWITQGTRRLHELGVQVRWCGRRDRVDTSLASALALVESMTHANDTLTLTLCVDYGGRDELAAAARALAAEAVAGTLRADDIGPADLARHLYVPELPDVDLLIRTSGEQRISNFLPWQLGYAELVFDPTPWPDYDLTRLRDAVTAYTTRERRFGAGAFTASPEACTPPPRSPEPAPSPR